MSGRWVEAAAASAAVTPGTTSLDGPIGTAESLERVEDALAQLAALLLEAAEDARVAAFQANDANAARRVLDEKGVDGVLPGVLAAAARRVRHARKAALADIDPARVRRERAQRRVGERVEKDDVGLAQSLRAAQRDEVGCTGAGADEGHSRRQGRRHDGTAPDESRAKRRRGSLASPW